MNAVTSVATVGVAAADPPQADWNADIWAGIARTLQSSAFYRASGKSQLGGCCGERCPSEEPTAVGPSTAMPGLGADWKHANECGCSLAAAVRLSEALP